MFQPARRTTDVRLRRVDDAQACSTGGASFTALRSPRYKFIQAPRPELYDLAADPGEATNVFGQHRPLAA